MRERLKEALARAGLLGVAEAVYARLNPHEARAAADAFRFYLYNHWLTRFPSNAVRLAYLRNVLGVQVGHDSYVHMGCMFEGERVAIGNHTVIGRDCYLGGSGGSLQIRDNVSITAGSYLFNASHDVNSPDFSATYGDVVIEDRAWLGARSMVMPGVRVGEGAVLGAMATATKDIPAYAIWGGVPARPIGERNRALTYTLHYAPYFV